jgi:hypothetical protein
MLEKVGSKGWHQWKGRIRREKEVLIGLVAKNRLEPPVTASGGWYLGDGEGREWEEKGMGWLLKSKYLG